MVDSERICGDRRSALANQLFCASEGFVLGYL